MDNTHVVAIRPDGKELYVYGYDGSDSILVVDTSSPTYPVIGSIKPPGRRVLHAFISFSPDSRHAYIARAIQRDYEEYSGSWGDFNKILIIDTAKREIESAISLPQNITALEYVIPSPDGRWLYFTGADFPARRLGIGRLDLQNKQMVGFVPLESINSISVSPDGKYIYVTQGGNLYRAPAPTWCNPPNLFSIIDAQSFQVISSVKVGDGPRCVAVTPDGGKAYISNQWSNDVSAVDLKTMNVIATINLGISPEVIAITPDGKKAYVTLPGTPTAYRFGYSIAVIDAAREIVLSKIKVHIEPISVAIHPDGKRAYVSDGNANGLNPSEVHVIDTVKDIYLRPIILRKAAQYTPTAVDVTPDGRKAFVVSEATGNLLVIDTTAGVTINSLTIQPRGVKISGDGSKVYVFSPQKLSVVDSNSLQAIKSIDLSKVYPNPRRSDQEAFRIALSSSENTAYLMGDTAEVVVVDLTKGEVVTTIPFAKGPIQHSRGLALTPDGSKLLASDYHSQTVAIIDTATNMVSAVPIANMPSEIKVSQDGKLAYVLQQGGTTMMTIIDISAKTVVQSVKFSVSGALDFELSHDERYVYVANFDPNFLVVYDLKAGKAAKVIDVGLDPYNTVSTPDKKLIYVTNFTTDDISVVDTTTNSVVKTIKLGR